MWTFKLALSFLILIIYIQENTASSNIFEGQYVDLGEIPWHVGVSSKAPNCDLFNCSGSIINSRWVLTSAYCVKDYSSWDLRFGSLRKNGGGELQTSVEGYYHSKYDVVEFYNCLGLIKIPKKLTFNEYISPIKLPNREDKLNDLMGELVDVSGWGKTIKNTESPYLMRGKLPVIANDECDFYYASGTIDNHMMCVSGPKKGSSCFGNSGSPVFIKKHGEPILIAVAVFEVRNNCLLGPSGNIRTAFFLDWIKDTMKTHQCNDRILVNDNGVHIQVVPVP